MQNYKVKKAKRTMVLNRLKSILATKNSRILVFVLLFALIGGAVLIISRAATPSVSLEAELGSLTQPATKISDSGASGGQAVAFGSTVPPTDCSPNAVPDGSVPSNPTPCKYGQASGPNGTWNFDWQDEFSGSSLDLTKWRPNWFGIDDTVITKSPNILMTNCEDPAQVGVSGGRLRLTLVNRSCTTNKGIIYTHASGLVTTMFDKVMLGSFYVETKMYMPSATGSTACANWSGIWTNGVATDTVQWPMFLESDVMECLGGGVAAHVHAGPAPGNENDIWKKRIGDIGQKSGWHTFGASLVRSSKDCSATPNTPDSAILTYYYNGVQLGSPYETCYKNTGLFVILKNDIAPSSLTNTLPSTVEFDYVRIWIR